MDNELNEYNDIIRRIIILEKEIESHNKLFSSLKEILTSFESRNDKKESEFIKEIKASQEEISND